MPQEADRTPRHPGERAADALRRQRLLWAVLVALVLGQLVAFWMLCSHQVRKAQMRDVSLQVQRVAVADCLQYLPRATLNSCADRVDPGRPNPGGLMPTGDKPAAAPGTMSSADRQGVTYQ